MISERISDDIPPQMKILNMFIPILMYFCSFVSALQRCKSHKAARHPMICDVINDVKLFPIVYRRIYCRIFFKLSSQTSRYKCKCIRTANGCFFVQCWRTWVRSYGLVVIYLDKTAFYPLLMMWFFNILTFLSSNVF